MLVAIIKGPTLPEAEREIQEALPYADLLELRLDFFSEEALSSLDMFQRKLPLPVIFTLRKKSEGGKCTLEKIQRRKKIKELLALEPDYFDIEAEEGEEFFSSLREAFPKVKLIASHHDFEKMPKDLGALLASMPKKGVWSHKIAARAHSAIDSLRMLDFLKKTKGRVSGITMFPEGRFARILAPIFGSYMSYGYAKSQGEEGQVSLQELIEIYHHRDLNEKTSIYALLGGNVERSQGHLFHNSYFQKAKKNSVYVKISLLEESLSEFLSLAKNLSFQGMSVTMPLKEKIIPHLDRVEEEALKIGAVNTLYLRQGKWVGENVDGKGVLEAIEEKRKVANLRLFVLGSGGFARAIVFEAIKRKAIVALFARREDKRKEFSSYFHVPTYGIEKIDEILLSQKYDLLINATSNGMVEKEEKLLIHHFPKEALIVEGVNNAETLLLKKAKEMKVDSIAGRELFCKQALLQQKRWEEG